MAFSVREFLRAVSVPAILALSACGGGGGGEPHWYYHFVCNGDSSCLSTNFAGTPSGTSDDLGTGQGGEASCRGLMNFGRLNWNVPPAEQWCDNSSSLNYPAPTLTLTVAPGSIVAGQSANVSWSSSHTSSCTASGAWSGAKALSGNQSVSPGAGTYTYTLSCTGAGGSVMKSASLIVLPVVNLSVSPASVALGQSATLSWSSGDTTSCTASGAWSGAQATSGTVMVTPGASASYTYTLACTATGGTTNSLSVTLAVVPSITLSVSPDNVSLGSSATINWSTQGASSCTASTLYCDAGNSCSSNGLWSGSKATSGSEGKTPTSAGTLAFTLGCSGTGGSAERTATLSVYPPGGTLSSVRFNNPAGITTDSSNNIYVGDAGYTIRKLTPAGAVTTFAGSGAIASNDRSNDGTGTAARFRDLLALTTDGSNNIHLAEYYLNTIRRITPGAVVTTYAGQEFTTGSADGIGATARFYYPQGIGADKVSGIVYVSDTQNKVIRKIAADGTVTTLAGAVGQAGSSDGLGSSARFFSPGGIVVDPAGNLYVADSSAIRKIAADGNVTTFASGVSGFSNLNGIARDSAGNLYVANLYYEVVFKVSPAGVVTTLAGSFGVSGTDDGNSGAARFHNPYGLATDTSDNVYVTDRGNHTVRKIAPNGDVTTLAGQAGVSGSGN